MSVKSPFRLFQPIIAGATPRERLLACGGVLAGMGLASLLTRLIIGGDVSQPLIIGPIAASAVLVFAVPTSPLAQPWPVLGGNLIGGLAGIVVALLLAPLGWSGPIVAAAAVPLGILAMSLFRCLHPPGGAMALLLALMVQQTGTEGLLHTLVATALNISVLLLTGVLFHRLLGRSYPHRPEAAPAGVHGSKDPPAAMRNAFVPGDIDAALSSLDESYDIDRDDLLRLVRQAEIAAISRARPDTQCADIMSRDIVSVTPDTSAFEARRLLLDHNIRLLPVLDRRKHVVGVIGLREIAARAPEYGSVGDLMAEATTAPGETPVAALLPGLTDGKAHGVVIVDDHDHAIGLVTQTDLLWAMARAVSQKT